MAREIDSNLPGRIARPNMGLVHLWPWTVERPKDERFAKDGTWLGDKNVAPGYDEAEIVAAYLDSDRILKVTIVGPDGTTHSVSAEWIRIGPEIG